MSTELVQVIDGAKWTTSLLVAEKFGKRHADVIRAIENLECSDEFGQRNFAFSSRTVAMPNGGEREQRLCHMTRDGFMMVVMGFTGRKAVEWKEKFIAAFNEATKPLSWIAARAEGKEVRKITTDIIAAFIEYARRQGSQSAEKYFMNFSKMVNAELLEIEGKKPANLRDHLNTMQLHQLSVAEQIISRSIVECMARGAYYKDVYQDAKKRIQVYASTVGRSRIGASERQVVGLLDVGGVA
jgi:Rha family phage regulatory protein